MKKYENINKGEIGCMKDMNISGENRQQISDLLYIEKDIVTRIGNEIEEIMRGRGRTNKEIRESLIYMLEEKLKNRVN